MCVCVCDFFFQIWHLNSYIHSSIYLYRATTKSSIQSNINNSSFLWFCYFCHLFVLMFLRFTVSYPTNAAFNVHVHYCSCDACVWVCVCVCICSSVFMYVCVHSFSRTLSRKEFLNVFCVFFFLNEIEQMNERTKVRSNEYTNWK